MTYFFLSLAEAILASFEAKHSPVAHASRGQESCASVSEATEAAEPPPAKRGRTASFFLLKKGKYLKKEGKRLEIS